MDRRSRGCKPDIQTALNLACYVAGRGEPLEAYFTWLGHKQKRYFRIIFFGSALKLWLRNWRLNVSYQGQRSSK